MACVGKMYREGSLLICNFICLFVLLVINQFDTLFSDMMRFSLFYLSASSVLFLFVFLFSFL